MITTEKLLHAAEELFGKATLIRHNNKNELVPMGGIVIGSGIVMMPIDSVVGDKTNTAADLLRAVLKLMPEVDAFIFWCETWMKGGLTQEEVDAGKKPRDYPDAREAIFMLVDTPDTSWTCHAFIDNHQVGPRQPWIKDSSDQRFTGRMAGWFRGIDPRSEHSDEFIREINERAKEVVEHLRREISATPWQAPGEAPTEKPSA